MESVPPILFNRTRLRKRRQRAAAGVAQHDFLWSEAAARVEETLSYITRAFPTVVAIGAQHLALPPHHHPRDQYRYATGGRHVFTVPS